MEPSDKSAEAFLAAVADDRRRADARELCGLLAEWTGEPPMLWGTSIVGFSPRKANLVVYLVGGFQDRYPKLLERLGPHKPGKGCLYVRRLGDVDREVLRALVERTVRVHRGAGRRAANPDA